MNEVQNTKRYDLEERTLLFAKSVRLFIGKLQKTISTIEDGKQVVRSSGSIGANYIEANEALSKKDFKMRIMICRKEAKETCYWLEILEINSGNLENERVKLLEEATQLRKIFGAILEKTK
jgi:four helix bundle protein